MDLLARKVLPFGAVSRVPAEVGYLLALGSCWSEKLEVKVEHQSHWIHCHLGSHCVPFWISAVALVLEVLMHPLHEHL